MKVIYKGKDLTFDNLTEGKIYEADWGWGDPNTAVYYIINDNGEGNCYLKADFTLLEDWREKRLKGLLDRND